MSSSGRLELGRSVGVADTTVRQYIDKLTDASCQQLKPGTENMSKSQVKHTKLFHPRLLDCCSALLNLANSEIGGYPKIGASWEGFVIDQIVQQLGVNPDETTIGERFRVLNSTSRRSRRMRSGFE